MVRVLEAEVVSHGGLKLVVDAGRVEHIFGVQQEGSVGGETGDKKVERVIFRHPEGEDLVTRLYLPVRVQQEVLGFQHEGGEAKLCDTLVFRIISYPVLHMIILEASEDGGDLVIRSGLFDVEVTLASALEILQQEGHDSAGVECGKLVGMRLEDSNVGWGHGSTWG
jgi:hypothetical protein